MTSPGPTSGLAAIKPQRLLSLDVVRGITIAFMIMVNNNGGPGSWGFMNHKEWNGLTPTDLVFPTFLFIVGVSTVFATEARLAKGAAKGNLAKHMVIRSVVLILFGLVVNNFPFFHLAHMRFYGVLQRIAACYLIVGLFYLADKRVWSKVALLIACLLGYWALVTLVPVPGPGSKMLLPGRDVPLLDKDQNIVAWVDRQLMPGHLYEEFDTHNTRDPEGLLSDIPAVGTALLGMITGIFLRSGGTVNRKALGLAAGCLACLALGYFWSIWFPLNKKMWTSSYVLVAAGYSLALLTVVYWTVEVKNWRKGWTYPWIVFGSNAIAAYMVSELLPGILSLADGNRHSSFTGWFFQHVDAKIPDPGWAAFSWSVLFTAVCFVPVWILYKKKIFLKA